MTSGWVARLVARFGAATVTVLGATGLLLALMVAAPGDPIDLLPNADQVRPVLEAQWQLDHPPWMRWMLHMQRVATLDLGTSFAVRPGAPVVDLIALPAMRTAWLVTGALVLVAVWGTGLAFVTAGRPSLTRLAVQCVSITPVFLAAHAAILLVNQTVWWAIGRGLISRPDFFALPDQPSWERNVLAMVILAIGSGALSEVHGEIEDGLVRVRASPWIDAARARGAPLTPLVFRALVGPVAATLASRTALLLGGAVVIEKVMLLHGAGALLWQAALLRDYELALSLAILAAVTVAAARLLADAIRVAADPRLRASS